MTPVPAPAAGAALGAAVARALLPTAVGRAPGALRRTNVSGASVPASLGGPVACGALAGAVLAAATGDRAARRAAASTGGLVAVLALAGLVDDLRGDEPARGFGGHVRAAARGEVTGGAVKVAAGGAAGLAVGLRHGRGSALETAALVALAANLVNLLDRAPGRAAKVALAAGAPLVAAGAPAWATASAGLWGALAACVPADLREDAMLGDAGANPVGAVLGLGLALSLSRPARAFALLALAALNAASELWSFSALIDRTPWLYALDRAGRPVKSRPAVLR